MLGGVALPAVAFKEEPSVRHGAIDAVEDLPGISSICVLVASLESQYGMWRERAGEHLLVLCEQQ